jgi:hypothetical protein
MNHCSSTVFENFRYATTNLASQLSSRRLHRSCLFDPGPPPVVRQSPLSRLLLRRSGAMPHARYAALALQPDRATTPRKYRATLCAYGYGVPIALLPWPGLRGYPHARPPTRATPGRRRRPDGAPAHALVIGHGTVGTAPCKPILVPYVPESYLH